MGLEVLFWIWVLTWMTKTAATDVLHAVKGTPNPRYELKRQRAIKAGQPVKGQPRYGSREWAADLLSDALVANTEKRRKAAKAQPIDDLAAAVREPKPAHPHDPNNTRNCPTCKGEVVLGGRPCPRCLVVQQRRNAEYDRPVAPESAVVHDERATPAPPWLYPEGPWPPTSAPTPDPRPDAARREEKAPASDGWTGMRTNQGEPMCQKCQTAFRRLDPPGECGCPAVTEHTAQIIQFPNPKNIEKEIIMANSEVTGLSTAIAFAEAAASAHSSFASGGSEGYTGALAAHDVGEGCIGSAMEAQEASGVAAAKWAKHREDLAAQMNVKEAYQGTPDAGNREFLLNG